MLGTKMLKSEFDAVKYTELATWCNGQEYKTIEDKGDYYEVVDCTPTQEQLNAVRAQEIKRQIAEINTQLNELDAAAVCAISDDNDTEYDVIVDGIVVTWGESEFNERYDTLSDTRIDLIKELKAIQ